MGNTDAAMQRGDRRPRERGGNGWANFLASVERVLVPKLKRTRIVVVDDLKARKVVGIEQAIEAATGRQATTSSPVFVGSQSD